MKTITSCLILMIILSSQAIAQTKTDHESKVHLTMLYEHYINLKSEFIKSNSAGVISMGNEVQRQLKIAEKSFEKLPNNKVWKTELSNMKNSIKAILTIKNIERQRANFAVLSKAMYNNIKAYGVLGMKTYYQHCPMALDGKGAYWLSLQEKIQNPYFGDKMLTCGKTKDTIE